MRKELVGKYVGFVLTQADTFNFDLHYVMLEKIRSELNPLGHSYKTKLFVVQIKNLLEAVSWAT